METLVMLALATYFYECISNVIKHSHALIGIWPYSDENLNILVHTHSQCVRYTTRGTVLVSVHASGLLRLTKEKHEGVLENDSVLRRTEDDKFLL